MRRLSMTGMLAPGILLILSTTDPATASDSITHDNFPDRQVLQRAHVGEDVAAIVKYLEMRCPERIDPASAPTLITQLAGADQPLARQARADLLTLGLTARRSLVGALGSPELRGRRCIDECLKEIDSQQTWSTLAAAVRELYRLEGTRAAGRFLRILPFVAPDDEDTAVLIWSALESAVRNDREVITALKKALNNRARFSCKGVEG